MNLTRRVIKLIILLILIGINSLIIYQSVFTEKIDLRINTITYHEENNHFLYEISVLSSKKLTESSTLKLFYEDGSQEQHFGILENMKRENVRIDSSKRLEYVLLETPDSIVEKDTENNQYELNTWSKPYKILESFSVPEYDSFLDKHGQLWLVSEVKQQKKGSPEIRLTVLAENGKSILVDNLLLSPPGIYSVHPIIKEVDEQIHILWSSFIDEKDVLFHSTFKDIAGEIKEVSKEKIESDIKLVWPTFLQNDNLDPVILVQTQKGERKIGFNIYQIKDSKVIQLAQLKDLNLAENPLANIDPEMFEKYGISKEQYLEDCEYDPDFFDGLYIHDLTFLKDSRGNYVIIWSEKDSRVTEFTFSKLDKQFQIITPRKDIASCLTSFHPADLSIITIGEKMFFFWTEIDNLVSGLNQISYTVFNENGDQIQDKIIHTGPVPVQICEFTAAVDEYGNFNLVWIDTRIGSAIRPNREIAFEKISPSFDRLLPMTNLNNDLIGQFQPKIKIVNGVKYLTYLNYKDAKYQLYLRNTDPIFSKELAKKEKWKDVILGLYNDFLIYLLSLGAQILFIIPLNLFAVAGLVLVILGFIFGKIQNRLLDWVIILLFILLLKLATIDALMRIPLIVLGNGNYLSLIIFGVFSLILALTFIFNRQMKFETRFYLIVAWLVIDAYVHTVVYYVSLI